MGDHVRLTPDEPKGAAARSSRGHAKPAVSQHDPVEGGVDRTATIVVHRIAAASPIVAQAARNRDPQPVVRGVDQSEVIGERGGAVDEPTERAITASSGTPLDPAFRGAMESAFQADFSAVKIHSGQSADDLNARLDAKAFTTGPNIFIRSGDFRPATPVGQRLLAHELSHVVQQSAGGTTLRRTPTRGDGWKATGGIIGWFGWSQTQIDAEFAKVTEKYTALEAAIGVAEDAGSGLADAVPGAAGIGAAKAARKKWNVAVNWDDRETALEELDAALQEVTGAGHALEAQREKEIAALTKLIGGPLSQAFLSTRSPKEAAALVSSAGAETVSQLADGLGAKQLSKLVATLTTGPLLKTLAPFGGKELRRLRREMESLDDVAAGSTHAEVKFVIDEMDEETVQYLAERYTARTMKQKLVEPLGGSTVVELTDEIEVAQVAELVGVLRPAWVKAMVMKKGTNTSKTLHEHRVRLEGVAARLQKADDIVRYWQEVSLSNLKKLWAAKPDGDVAAMLDGLGPAAIASLLKGMNQAQLYEHAARLTKPGLKGLGEAMEGSAVRTITAAPQGVGGHAAPGDDVLTVLGADHPAAMKSATATLGIDALNLALRRCAVHLDAAETAAFLVDATKNKWKRPAQLGAFFDMAGADIVRLATLAKRFADDGNTGTRSDVAGGASPAKAEHSVKIGEKFWKVAEGDIKHYMSGHTYSHFAMTDANASRGDSSVWPTGTDRSKVSSDAKAVLESAEFAGFVQTVGGAYAERTINGFRVGVDPTTGRMTKLFKVGTTLAQADVEAVAKLFQSKGS